MAYACNTCGETHATGEICPHPMPYREGEGPFKILIPGSDIIYRVYKSNPGEVCYFQGPFAYADGFERQLHSWTQVYLEVIYDDGEIVMVEPPKRKNARTRTKKTH